MKYISKVNLLVLINFVLIPFKSKLIHYSLNLWAKIYKGEKKKI